MRVVMNSAGMPATGGARGWRPAGVDALPAQRTALRLGAAAPLPVPRRFQPRLAAGFDDAVGPEDRDRTVPRFLVEAPFGAVLASAVLLAVAAILIAAAG